MRAPVLIPRPETEELVLWVLRYVRNKKLGGTGSSPLDTLLGSDALSFGAEDFWTATTDNRLVDENDINFLDVGTGSGAISVALVRSGEFPCKGNIAINLSADACSLAVENISTLSINKNIIRVIHSDFRTFLRENKKKNLPRVVVANLPYVPSSRMSIDESNYEDKCALDGGGDGMDVIADLLKALGEVRRWEGSSVSRGPFVVFLEVDATHTPELVKERVNAAMNQTLRFDDSSNNMPQVSYAFRKDMCGKDRFVICEID